MRHRFINLLAVAVIGVGATFLATPEPAAAADGACCTNGSVLVCGDKCTGSSDGTCTCE